MTRTIALLAASLPVTLAVNAHAVRSVAAQTSPLPNPIIIASTESVSVVGVYKSIIHQQTSAASVTPVSYMGTAFIEGSVNANYPAGPRLLITPAQQSLPFQFDDWSWAVESEFSSQAQLNSAFPEGSYTINAGNASVRLNLAGASYPAAPRASVSVGVWNHGRLQVSAAQALAGFTISSSQSTGNGFTTLEIWSDEDPFEMFRVNEQGYSAIQAQVPPAALKLGKTYVVAIAFDNVVDAQDARAFGPGAMGFAFYSSETEFEVEVVESVAQTALPVTVTPILTRAADGTMMLSLSWTSAVSHSYVLETSADLKTWTTAGRTTTAIVGQNSRNLLIGSGARAFYRLRAVQ